MRIKHKSLISLLSVFSGQKSLRTIINISIIFLIFSGGLLAQGSYSVPSVNLSSPSIGPVITFYGAAQYRLRLRYIRENIVSGSDSSQQAYLHHIGYYFGMRAKVNEQVSFQAQLGNDWVNTEQVTYLTSNHAGRKNSVFPYFHLAFAKWDPGIFSISAGIVPQNGYGALDLLERSLALGNYGSSQGFGAGQVGWATGTNNSITGLKIGVPVLKSKVKLGVEVLATIVDDSASARKQSWFTKAKNNPSQQLYVIDIPITAGGLAFNPQFATVLFRKYNYSTEEGDNEYDIGFTGSYKFNDIVSVRLNAAYATFSNKDSHKSNTTADSTEFRRVGTLAGAGITLKAGSGNILFDVNYSSDENTETVSDSKNSFYYGDIKYVWSVNKNFEITPRVRYFRQNYPDVSPITDKNEIRPELILTGKF